MDAHHHHRADAPSQTAPECAASPAGLAPHGAAPAGLSPPQKDKCPELAGGGALKGQGKANTADCADTTAECKSLATLRARLALAGWALTATPDNPHGAFTVSRWGMVRDLIDLASVASFTDRVGAA